MDAYEEKIEFCDDYWQIYSVCDGIGGAGIGDISSRFIQTVICEKQKEFAYLDPMGFHFAAYIQRMIDEADLALRERLYRYQNLPVGCSLALLMFSGDQCYSMSIGSCRIYLYRDGKLYKMSQDHVTYDPVNGNFPLIFLGNHLGTQRLLAQNLTRMRIQMDDVFFICSDGITRALTDKDILRISSRPASFQEQVSSLFRQARRIDSRDNQTLLGLQVKSRMAFSEQFEPELSRKNENLDFIFQTENWQQGATTRFASAQLASILNNQAAAYPTYSGQVAGQTRQIPVLNDSPKFTRAFDQEQFATIRRGAFPLALEDQMYRNQEWSEAMQWEHDHQRQMDYRDEINNVDPMEESGQKVFGQNYLQLFLLFVIFVLLLVIFFLLLS